MDLLQRWTFIGLLLIALTGSALSTITEIPEDTTAEQGEDVILRCVSDNREDMVEWVSSQYDNGNSAIFDTTDGIADPDKYELVDDSGTDYSLVVKNTEWDDAGTYSCNHYRGTKTQVHLVLLDVPTPVVFTMTEGDVSEVKCRMDYASHTVQGGLAEGHLPQLKAYIDEGDPIPASKYERIENGAGVVSYLTYTLNHTAQYTDHDKEFKCVGYTEVPKMELTAVEDIEVQFKVRDLELAPRNDKYYVGEVINCTAMGYPPPTVSWTATSLPGTVTVTGAQLEIKENMIGENTWVCKAVNTAPNSVQLEESITFTVEKGNPPVDGSGEEETGSNAAVIAVAVIVPILIIAIIAIVIFIWWRRKKQQPSSSEKPTPYNQSGYDQDAHDGGGVNPAVDMRTDPNATPTTQAVPTGYHAYTGPGAPPNVGRDSPGYGDLGIKHMNGTPNISFDDSFVEEKPQQRPPPSNQPPAQQGPAYSNQVYNPSPKGSAQDLTVAGDGGTAV